MKLVDMTKLPEPIVLVGGGGHCAVVLDAIRASGCYVVTAILDKNPGVDRVLDVPVRGNDNELATLAAEGIHSFIVTLGSTGDSSERRRLHALGVQHGLVPATVIHPAACVSKRADIGAGVYLGALAHVGPRTVIGDGAIVNTHATVDHDCIVGQFAHLAPGCVLSGSVRIGDGAHVGPGAVLVNSVIVGARAIVGAGSVVTRDVQEQAVVWGNPASPRR
jgi:sugar O-acyltransferase (sialic acid O-acetyltransferase NeuD family)